MARADLHVHSKASNRPPEWILRQLSAPESYTEPKEIYRVCRERGMDFVTLSDHDTIDGALSIAHLPGVFLSEEVTVCFPEDGCEIHLLVTGISEAQHREIQRLRTDVYALRDFLRQEDVICSVAHPLYRVNDKLTLAQLEKLFVLFNRFEALNGIHERRANALVNRILTALTPEVVADLAAKHRLEPWGPTPWIKTMTGGSDDHGGLYIATTYTETPPATTVEDYLAHLRAGRHQPAGETGSSLRLVQSLYSIALEYYRRQFPELLGSRNDPFSQLLRELGVKPRDKAAPGLAFFRRAAQTVEDATFGTASKASQKSLASLLAGVVRHLRRGRLGEALAALSHLAPLALSIAPYLVALKAQHKDADLLESSSLRFLGQRPEGNRPDRMAWFTDTLTDVNGVARTVRTLAGLSREHGRDLVTVTCSQERLPDDLRVARFKPLFEIPLPGYESLTLSVPPVLEVLEHCERQRYSEILVSTPGPIGLLGLLCGKLLGIRVTGIDHTDFARYVRQISDSPALENLSRRFLRWFFGAMDEVYVESRFDRDRLASLPSRVQSAA